MTTMYVQNDVSPLLIIEGELNGFIRVHPTFGMRVVCSDGSILHFRKVGGRYKAFLLRKGDLMDELSVEEFSDKLFLRKGLRWAFAHSQFYEILCEDVTKKLLQNKLVQANKTGEAVEQHA